jgi:hypothetical protein
MQIILYKYFTIYIAQYTSDIVYIVRIFHFARNIYIIIFYIV